MPLHCINGQIIKSSRLAKRERTKQHKRERVANNEAHLRDRRIQLHNYQMKQNRRWLQAKMHTDGNNDIPQHVCWPLMQHWTKTEHHQQNPKISDGVALTDDVKAALDLLRDERAMAAEQQGNPERVTDWWVQPEIKSKKKGKKGKNANRQGAKGARSVSVEGLGNDVRNLRLGDGEEKMEVEEASPSLEEGFQGSYSPVMLSPEGSVVGDGDEVGEE